MKFALYGLHRGESTAPDTLARQAKLAEAAGFDALWVGDHIALPRELGAAAELPRHEALVALTYLAALTTMVKLGVGVLVLPQRQPVLLAKQLSSIDVLSKGRLTIGIGVGYLESELRATGASLADRGARADEYLAAMLKLREPRGRPFTGRFVSFADVVERPLPTQVPHPPIVIGGNSPAAHRRAVKSGNGWYGWQLDLQETADALAALRETSNNYERPAELGELEITITPRTAIDLDTARRYTDLGVHQLAIQPSSTNASAMDELISMAGDSLIGRL